ncbi:alanine racemase [Flammeovirga sp. EKP202]|uniref:diaminopimelate decarboxylase family protein n=1 Tax=Flammeovirga sp. EKP202 TaxID=2770592 RepID=UPI00165EDBDA|nr:alanine racemase [Flammeovirga sp. EKP202]MBD0400031.1 alanine racemase [Flammeovirga sp. EKP202]
MSDIKMNPLLSVKDGNLFIEDINTVEIAKKFGTPLFVVSENILVQNYLAFQNTFQKFYPEGRIRVMAAVKANPTVAVRRVLTKAGCGCDTFGAGELETAIRGGVPYEDIAVNGSIKSDDIIRKAIDLGIHIVLDNKDELGTCQKIAKELGKEAHVMLRIKPYMKDLDEPSDFFPARLIREMTQTVKYGIPTSEVREMLPQFADCPNVKLVGVHTHAGRHSKKPIFWQSLVQSVVDMIKEIHDGVGNNWSPSIVSVGGGFPAEMDKETRVAVTDYDTPHLEDFAKVITETFRTGMKAIGLSSEGVILEIEPGRAMYNESGIHLFKVHNMKHETANGMDYRWAETDTSETFLSVGGLNVVPPFDLVACNKADQKYDIPVDLVGITCNYDCLAEQHKMPQLEKGDTLAFLNTGSYIEPYTCNFNALPRPGMVMVKGDTVEWVKTPETQEEVFSRHVVPERLKDI